MLKIPIGERDHLLGPPSAPLRLVEYGDYQCPYCRAANGPVHEVKDHFGDQLVLAFRHFPLTEVHPYAQLAAEAAEAAGAQGRFWQMHDLLFANQDMLSPSTITELATTLELDVDRFVSELGSHVHRPRVREDFLGGVRSGVNGTPTFFIDGHRHDGGWDAGSLIAALLQVGRGAGAAARR